MHDGPAVSIIMPTFNRSYIIASAIESVLRQTYDNWELIIIDDGSTDNTRGLVESIADKRIVYHFHDNRGRAESRNTGLSLARGTWVAYLDSDNVLLPSYLSTMLQWLSNHPEAVFAIPRGKRTIELHKDGHMLKSFDASNETPPKLELKDIFMGKIHLDTNGLIHLRRLFDEGISWDPQLHGMEDWDFAMCIGERYPNGFVYVEEVLYEYHQRFGGDGAVSNSTYGDWAGVFEHMYQKHKNDHMLTGQTWYPRKVEKWKRLQQEFDEGKLPPYYLYYFQG